MQTWTAVIFLSQLQLRPSVFSILLKEIGNKISFNAGESREASFLHQRISMLLVQRFYVILLHDSLPSTDCAD